MKLEEVLERSRPDLEGALVEAERDLVELRRQVADLEHLIIRARAALGDVGSAPESATTTMTLHEAMLTVLVERGGGWMSVKDLVSEVNSRHLYEMRDGRPVEAGQIHARVGNYDHLFEKDGTMVRPRHEFKRGIADKTGAFWAATTDVHEPEGAVMHVGARVAYQTTLALRDGERPDEYAQRLSRMRAISLLARGRFEDGATEVALLTSFGWQPVGDFEPDGVDRTVGG